MSEVQSNHRSFIVVGAESSGTRALTRWLIEMGCMGSHGHNQPFVDQLPKPTFKPIVIRYSVPHARQWPNFTEIIAHHRRSGFEPHGLWIIRDLVPTVKSQLTDFQHADTVGNAMQNILRAMSLIPNEFIINSVPIIYLTYANLYNRPDETGKWLAKALGLPRPPKTEWRDEDDKHWKTGYNGNTGD